jgi:hypothetical protein
VKYASFRYDLCSNLGDEIQSIATEQHLPQVDVRLDRDSLASAELPEPHIVVFQGWFSEDPRNAFPPCSQIIPVFVGFHITDLNESREVLLRGENLRYLKAHEPIGCRDEGTRAILEAAGVEAYVSLCLTLTFPRRADRPAAPRPFIVDAESIRIPAGIRSGAESVTHGTNRTFGDEIKRASAQRLLDVYREQASLVVTTKLHCALPCIAMGIPVVFFGDHEDERFGVLREIGLPIYPLAPRGGVGRWMWRFRIFRGAWRRWSGRVVDWNPQPLDIEGRKADLIALVKREIRRAEMTAALPADGDAGA